jgi:hypothetical protein
LAEWLRSGLQSRLHRFDSGRRLPLIKPDRAIPLKLAGINASADSPRLRMVAVYAVGGAVEFLIQAWLLSRRQRQVPVAT